MVSLRMNASSSPRGTVRRVCSRTKSTARSGASARVVELQEASSEAVKKYIHVHRYKQTGLFGAWFNDPSKPGKKERLYFGSHLTDYLAARAQDRAALKYRPHALDPDRIKLNFKEEDYVDDEQLRAMLTCEEFGALLKLECRPTYKKMEHSPLLHYFMTQEEVAGNPIVVQPAKKAKKLMPLEQYLRGVFTARRGTAAEVPDLSFLKESKMALYLKALQDPIPSPTYCPAAPKAEPEDHGPNQEREGHTQLQFRFRSVIARTKPRALRSSVRVPSGCKPLLTTPIPGVATAKPESVKEEDTGKGIIRLVVVWVPQRPRWKLPMRLASRFRLVAEVRAPGTVRCKLHYKLQKLDNKRAPEPSQDASVLAEVAEAVPEVEMKEPKKCGSNLLLMLASIAAVQEPQKT